MSWSYAGKIRPAAPALAAPRSRPVRRASRAPAAGRPAAGGALAAETLCPVARGPPGRRQRRVRPPPGAADSRCVAFPTEPTISACGRPVVGRCSTAGKGRCQQSARVLYYTGSVADGTDSGGRGSGPAADPPTFNTRAPHQRWRDDQCGALLGVSVGGGCCQVIPSSRSVQAPAPLPLPADAAWPPAPRPNGRRSGGGHRPARCFSRPKSLPKHAQDTVRILPRHAGDGNLPADRRLLVRPTRRLAGRTTRGDGAGIAMAMRKGVT